MPGEAQLKKPERVPAPSPVRATWARSACGATPSIMQRLRRCGKHDPGARTAVLQPSSTPFFLNPISPQPDFPA